MGERLDLTSGALTAAVDRLEKKTLVERRFDATDRRVRQVHLTSQGQKAIEPIFKQHAQDMENAFAGLTAKERESLIHLLKKAGKFASEQLSIT
jgi:DNA-binding MarR family transcriptional regulator